MIVSIMMGRKGSKGFPGKNLCDIGGHPLCYYPMKAGLDCKMIDKSFISTDDEELKALAVQNGVEVIHRPQELCGDAALGEHVYVHAYEHIKNLYGNIDIVVLLMCNAPLVTPKMISQGIEALQKDETLDSAVTVSKYNMWSPLRARKVDENGLLKPFVPFEAFGDPKTLNCDRDSQGDIWFADMGVSVVRAKNLEDLESGLLPQKWMGQNIYPIYNEAGLDVDYEWQIPQVEFWLKNISGKYE